VLEDFLIKIRMSLNDTYYYKFIYYSYDVINNSTYNIKEELYLHKSYNKITNNNCIHVIEDSK